jgi:SWI/SNF related-matrix-associated actin-dependent regulator of chromatin subfamily C
VDGDNDGLENDSDKWTDEETLLLLEGIEKYNDNWDDIAGHVGTKSKAQCIYHFIRLPVEDGLLENVEVPNGSVRFRARSNGYPHSDSNGSTSGIPIQSFHHGNELPFINSSNPVMSLVAFLASAIGPRVAASCAHAALSFLTRDDDPRLAIVTECFNFNALVNTKALSLQICNIVLIHEVETSPSCILARPLICF